MLRKLLGCGLVAAAVISCHDAPQRPVRGQLSRPVFFDADRIAPSVPATQTRLAGAVTSTDSRRGAARFVWTHDAAPPSVLPMPAHRRRGATNAAGVAALWHVDHQAARWGLDAAALEGIHVTLVHDTGRGAIIVKLAQQVGGLEVMRTSLAVVMDRDLKLVALSGGLHPTARPNPAIAAKAPAISAPDAIERALADAGAARPALVPAPSRAGYLRFIATGLATPARVKQVLYPVGMQLVPAWETEVAISENRRIQGYHHVFSADDGRLLYRASLTDDAAFKYRVWADATGDLRPLDGPQGDYTPHPTEQPDGFDPAFVAPNLVTVDGFNTKPGGGFDPWLPAGATTTQGNNVDAYADLDFQDGFSGGDLRPTVTSAGVFDRAYNTSAEPDGSAAQSMASVTHLFYVVNWMHDYFYDSGFTEAAGNAQTSNLGRGGIESDALHAEGQDSSGTDNANMFTPADGESPVMQMFLFTAPQGGVRRDGTLDSHVIEHEWGHYIHHRLVDCGSQECGAMSEGWGDAMALFQSIRPTDDLHGTWGMGGYPFHSFSPNSAYFGIRRYPYSVNFGKSPLTYRFMQSGVPMPVGPAFSDIDFLAGSDNYEVHNAGEIWCAMLWEGMVDMVNQSKGPAPRLTFDQARRHFADYIVAGMIAAPVEPTFTEQRDAILAAAAAADSTDFVLLANSFARRGFGSGAVSPDLNSFDGSGIVESFAVTGTLDVVSATVVEDAVSCDGDGILDVGETGRVIVVVRNVGAATLAGPTVSVSSITQGVSFPNGASTTIGSIAPFATRSAAVAIRLDEGQSLTPQIVLNIGLSDASAALTSVSRTTSATTNLDITANASTTDSFEEPDLVWTASAGGWGRTADPDTTNVASVQLAGGGDHTLQTPALQVGTGNLTLAFNHRFRFASTPIGGDGGVIEVSTNGTTFTDIRTIADPGYNGTIAGTGNPLAGRLGFTGFNNANPGYDAVTVNLGTQFAGQTIFLRFRAAAATQSGKSQWDVDDVAVGGLTNKPFPLVSEETGSCLPGARPIADAGNDFSVASGANGALDGTGSTDPDGGLLTFEWNQISGQTLPLSSNTVAQPTFTAPTTPIDRIVRYSLVVRDPDGRVSAPTEVRVTVLGTDAPDGAPDGAPDAAVPVDAPAANVDAAPAPDGGMNPLDGDGGGCCDAGSDPRSGFVLGFGLLFVLLRRRR